MNNLENAATAVACDSGYAALKAHLIAVTGLAYYRDRDDDLADVIGRRLTGLGLRDCRGYLDFLLEDQARDAELDGLVAQLTIGETYFFRDPQQFHAIRTIIIPDILDRKRDARQLRIWSAGCATGAEPYSLAILLGREMAHRIAGWHISILATDINRRFLAEAAEGRFQEWAFRATRPELRQECFSCDAQGWKVLPDHRQWIKFDHCNLVDRDFPSRRDEIAEFDLILCRNVMIYFDHETRQRLIRQFHASLARGGWFLVGAAEPNLESFTDFEQVDAAGTTIYRRTEKSGLSHATGAEPVGLAAWPPLPDGVPSSALEAAEPDRCSPQPLTPDPLNPVTQFDRALLEEQLGNLTEAERCLRQAIYLDRHFVLAHYHLGLSLSKKNRWRQARRSFRNVLQLVRRTPDAMCVLHGESIRFSRLAALSREHVASLGGA